MDPQGVDPCTFWLQTRCSTNLELQAQKTVHFFGPILKNKFITFVYKYDSGWIRTNNILVNNQALLPLSYGITK